MLHFMNHFFGFVLFLIEEHLVIFPVALEKIKLDEKNSNNDYKQQLNLCGVNTSVELKIFFEL